MYYNSNRQKHISGIVRSSEITHSFRLFQISYNRIPTLVIDSKTHAWHRPSDFILNNFDPEPKVPSLYASVYYAYFSSSKLKAVTLNYAKTPI